MSLLIFCSDSSAERGRVTCWGIDGVTGTIRACLGLRVVPMASSGPVGSLKESR